MPIECSSCNKQLSTESGIPRFCSNCGSSLEGIQESVQSAEFAGITEAFAVAQPQAAEIDSDIDPTLTHATASKDERPIKNALPPDSYVGPFRIIKTLGQGGMGTVYEAVHTETGQLVALKLLSKSVRTTQETIQRFHRESQIAASINHPRSTFVYQAGQHQGQFYITMELMAGGTLSDIVKSEGPIPVEQAVDYVLDIISGLKAAHQVGIVHRDLKPSNCFIDQRGRVKIGDFGLAKSFMTESSLTQTGTFMGTPQFAAPEQLRASEVDERADIYAVGGTLFYLLSGRAPFKGNAAQVIASIASDTPPKVRTVAPDVPLGLSRLVAQTLEKDPARRPENLEALRRGLLAFSTRGATTPDVGRRLAAFYLDNAFLLIITMVAGSVLGAMSQLFPMLGIENLVLANLLISFPIGILYFAIQEWRWGTTLGKWMFGMRVVGKGNSFPTFAGSLVRAIVVPGISILAQSLPAMILNFDPNSLEGVEAVFRNSIELEALSFLSWIPNLLCFVTATRANGFRGVHEMLSGTRVVRLAGSLEYERPKDAPVTMPISLSSINAASDDSNLEAESGEADKLTFGDYEAIGLLGRRSGDSQVLLGRDTTLDREVWIVTNPSAISINDGGSDDPVKNGLQAQAEKWERRKAISRSARLRILAEKTDSEPRWVVTEAVKGMPLIDYINSTGNVDWRSFRPLLRELAYELAKSEQEGTMPGRLSLKSVWLDQSGRTKLLDQPVSTPNLNEADSSQDDSLDSFQLIASLLDAFISKQLVPAHVLTFRRELEIFRTEPNTLNKIGQRLGELAEIPSAWRWDDRIGTLAATLGVEYGIALTFALIFAPGLPYFFGWGWQLTSAVMVLIGSLAAMIIGASFRGGPVFRLSGVLVRRNKTLEPASLVRCALRNWVAWLPLIISVALGAIMAQQFLLSESAGTQQNSGEFTDIAAYSLFAMLPLLLLSTIGLIHAIFFPARGLADLIAGTRLIRK